MQRVGRRIALIADIHANDEALSATLAEISRQGITEGLVVGDVVMRGSQPRETVDRLMELGWPCVVGNTDRKVIKSVGDDVSDKKRSKLGNRWWTRDRLNPEQLAWLASLEVVERADLDGHRIVVVHGSPEEVRCDLGPGAESEALTELAGELEADCVVSAHTHLAGAHWVGDTLFVNPGSVGETGDPLDRYPRWAWLDSVDGRLEAHLEVVEAPLTRLRIKKARV